MMSPSPDQATPQVTLVRDVKWQLALEPTDFDGAWRLAVIAAGRQLCGVKTPEDAFIRIAAGRELGLTTFQALRLVYVVKGRPSLDASFMHALCLMHSQCEYFEMVESTYERAVWRAKRKGRPEQTMVWDTARADRAGLLAKGQDKETGDQASWHAYREAMLNARAKADLARAVFPDALNGISAREELDDGEDDATPPVQTTPAPTAPKSAPRAVAPHAANVADAEVLDETKAAPAPTPPIAQAPARDFERERDGIKQAITDAKTDDDRKSVRAAIKEFAKDGGAPFVDELKRFYEVVHSAPTAPAGATP